VYDFPTYRRKLTWINAICIWWTMRSNDCDIMNCNVAVHPEKQFQISLSWKLHYCITLNTNLSSWSSVNKYGNMINPSLGNKPAIYRVNSPKWWVQESYIRNENPGWIHQLDQMRTCIIQCFVPKLVPPDTPLTIYSSIVTFIGIPMASINKIQKFFFFTPIARAYALGGKR